MTLKHWFDSVYRKYNSKDSYLYLTVPLKLAIISTITLKSYYGNIWSYEIGSTNFFSNF